MDALARHGRVETLQPPYHLFRRDIEDDVLPWCHEHRVGVLVYGPLAHGLLAGKFDEDTEFVSGDFRQQWQTDPIQNAVYRRDLAKVRELKALAQNGRTLAQAALAFTLLHPAVTTVIPGVKTPAQVGANLDALSAPPLSEADRAWIDRVTPPGGGRKIWPA
jgi:aryl-alcohol dehydrogenase-like predicted oxidoreductase